MFKVILASFFGLIFLSSHAFANAPFLCSECGDPYTANGQQTFLNYAHNLAWGSNPVRLTQHRFGLPDDNGFNAGAWDVTITNSANRSVTVRYRPSLWRVVAKIMGIANGKIDSFKLILPNDRVVPTQLIYNPGEDYEVDPQAGNENDSSSSGSGGGSNHTSPNLGGSLPEGNFGFGFGFDSLPSHSTVTWTITTSFYRVENG